MLAPTATSYANRSGTRGISRPLPGVRPTAFGNALGGSIAESMQGGVDWSSAPDESAAETARLNRTVVTQVDANTVIDNRPYSPSSTASEIYNGLVSMMGNPAEVDASDATVLAAAKGFSLGGGPRDAGAGRGFVNPPLAVEESGAVYGDGLKVDPSKLSRFWTSDSVGARYAPSLGMKEVLDYFNPVTRWEGFKEGFSISGVVDGVGQFLSDLPGSLERGGLAMQERTRQYFEAGRRGDFEAAARFEAELAGSEAAGLVVGLGAAKGMGISVRAFNAIGGVTSDLLSSSLAPYTSIRLGVTELGDILSSIGRLSYVPSSGVDLVPTAGKTTTILGSYNNDMRSVLSELGNVKSTDFGPRVGGFNVLNVPDNLYAPKTFWGEYNRPWLGNAIDRGDDVLMATRPGFDVPDVKSGISVLLRPNAITGKMELSGFGREYLMMRQNGYIYQNGLMVKKW